MQNHLKIFLHYASKVWLIFICGYQLITVTSCFIFSGKFSLDFFGQNEVVFNLIAGILCFNYGLIKISLGKFIYILPILISSSYFYMVFHALANEY